MCCALLLSLFCSVCLNTLHMFNPHACVLAPALSSQSLSHRPADIEVGRQPVLGRAKPAYKHGHAAVLQMEQCEMIVVRPPKRIAAAASADAGAAADDGRAALPFAYWACRHVFQKRPDAARHNGGGSGSVPPSAESLKLFSESMASGRGTTARTPTASMLSSGLSQARTSTASDSLQCALLSRDLLSARTAPNCSLDCIATSGCGSAAVDLLSDSRT